MLSLETNGHKRSDIFFLRTISVFILSIAIRMPISENAKVITINGCSIEGSIEGEDNLLILAG